VVHWQIRVFYQNEVAIGIIDIMNMESLAFFLASLHRGTPFNSVNI